MQVRSVARHNALAANKLVQLSVRDVELQVALSVVRIARSDRRVHPRHQCGALSCVEHSSRLADCAAVWCRQRRRRRPARASDNLGHGGRRQLLRSGGGRIEQEALGESGSRAGLRRQPVADVSCRAPQPLQQRAGLL